MKIAIFAYSRQGCKTARTVMEHFKAEEIRAFTKERFEESGFQPLCQPSSLFYGSMFEWADTMVFIGSCGIAVRKLGTSTVSVRELAEAVEKQHPEYPSK